MTDLNEVLLNCYEEAIDMGMSPNRALKWAREKTGGYKDSPRTVTIREENEILKKTVRDIQQELSLSYIRNKELKQKLNHICKLAQGDKEDDPRQLKFKT